MRIYKIADIQVTPEQLREIAMVFNTDLEGRGEFEIDAYHIKEVKSYIAKNDRKAIKKKNVDLVNFYTI